MRIRKVIRSYMSLPLLPYEHIKENFLRINNDILDDDYGLKIIFFLLL